MLARHSTAVGLSNRQAFTSNLNSIHSSLVAAGWSKPDFMFVVNYLLIMSIAIGHRLVVTIHRNEHCEYTWLSTSAALYIVHGIYDTKLYVY